ncbi:hypothetical protein IIA79_04320 [bacterium]|nr:hypothetical protein [bacterium]
MGVADAGCSAPQRAGLYALTAVTAVVVLASCDKVDAINARAYREYHQSRWEVAAAAYFDPRAGATFPAEPIAPRVCRPRVDGAYAHIVDATSGERASWRELLPACGTAVQFVAEMLSVLMNRDVVNIEKLAPQIEHYIDQTNKHKENWRGARQGLADTVNELANAWKEVWPGHDLDFDLSAAAGEARDREAAKLNDLRLAALSLYYDNEYARLAATYLDYEPPGQDPLPALQAPKGCERLEGALKELEAALLVRYSLDEAIERDVARIEELAWVDLSSVPWDEIQMPRGRHAEYQVSASIARLKLLKYVDELLTDCLDLLLREVDLAWGNTWPGAGVETNIFAYAGLQRAGQILDDPMTELTFRK